MSAGGHFEAADTIAAVATAPGAGGVGVIRLSGPKSHDILRAMFRPAGKNFRDFTPRMLHHGHVLDAEGREADDALVVFFPGPHSFTGEDCAEIQGHGGPAVLAALLDSVLSRGARMAERGEFTRRAFLNGRMDLSQAEAVAEIIAAPSREGVYLASAKLDGLLGRRVEALRERLEYLRQRVCLAIDFPDEEGECLPPQEFTAIADEVAAGIRALLAGYERARCWREGALVVLAGRVNAGKSSLMNAFLGRERAIVTEKPGTTRDYLEEQTTLAGLPVRLVDTAGLRDHSEDSIELEGMRRGRELAKNARCVLLVLDGSLSRENADLDDAFRAEGALVDELGPERCLVVWNKADLCPLPERARRFHGADVLPVSARSGEGVDELAAAIRRLCLKDETPEEGDIAPNLRQASQLRRALEALEALKKAIALSVPPDLCSIHLETASAHLADITGLNSTEDTLNAIFSSFCIGK
ncbi:tRNA uridine-5-carboxymethylaminomethyl(34) synthesis GTPase MnmE [uncultured Mailhella sp.]|uniref:tRNA uridine-5-carboxymethylaminomethyl(34) synthesis GTPase MnmE n=1 Tax=uncultured Mailhella sp. TaxID=1981031 RepID=UPI0025F23DC3|nr:tRNA uridine-5-carboxymethylaminomethyl(34) synthesis GTPase MnmE [uncultured Mailhella sp.]